jgi:hypothetical protein
MTLKSTNHRLRRGRDIHKALDAYVEWRDACIGVRAAYGAWRGRRGSDAALAFYVYENALEREERAANVYAKLARALGEVTGAGPPQRRPEISASQGA